MTWQLTYSCTLFILYRKICKCNDFSFSRNRSYINKQKHTYTIYSKPLTLFLTLFDPFTVYEYIRLRSDSLNIFYCVVFFFSFFCLQIQFYILSGFICINRDYLARWNRNQTRKWEIVTKRGILYRKGIWDFIFFKL